MFKYFDRTGKGYISREDLPTAIRALGFLVTTFELRDLAAYLDPDRTKCITLKQFLIGVYAVGGRKPNVNEIQSSLRVFDRTSTGRIQVDEMKQILMTIGDIVNPSEVQSQRHVVWRRVLGVGGEGRIRTNRGLGWVVNDIVITVNSLSRLLGLEDLDGYFILSPMPIRSYAYMM